MGREFGIDQRLVLAHTARKDFSQALSWAEAQAPNSAVFSQVNVSIAQAKVGLEPAFHGSHFLQAAEQSEPSLSAGPLRVRSVQLLMAEGYIDQALVHAKHNFNNADDYSALIMTAHEANLDTRPPVGKVKSISGSSAVERTLSLAYSHFGSLRYNTQEGLAGFVLKQRLSLGLPVDQDLVDQWAKNSKKPALDIASKYAEAGYPDRALELWQDTKEEPGQPKRARVLSEIAISFANKDDDPPYIVGQAMDLLGRFKNKEGRNDHFHKGEIIANLAIAEYKIGGDGDFYIRSAIQEASREQSNMRSDILLYIAEAQYQHGGTDPSSTLKEALNWADEFFVKHGNRSNDYYIDTTTYQFIAEAYAKAQIFDGAKEALSKLDLYADEGDLDNQIMSGKIDALTFIAEREARAGLSEVEIQALDRSERQRLVQSLDPKVAEAVATFYSQAQ